MLTVISEVDTVFKTSVLGSSDLANFEKAQVAAGQSFPVTSATPFIHQHLRLELVTPITASDGSTQLQEVFAYDPHVRVEGTGIERPIRLDVPYFSQLNNDTHLFGAGSRQCNTTANAMLADFLLNGQLTLQAKERGLKEPESVYMALVRPYGDTTSHEAQTRALKDLGIESYFSTTLPLHKIVQSLEAQIPVVIGVIYKTSGHIILVVGRDPLRNIWLIHDPYGIRYGTSNNYDIGAHGAYDVYTHDTLAQLFDPYGTGGWGRVVTHVKGKPTGL